MMTTTSVEGKKNRNVILIGQIIWWMIQKIPHVIWLIGQLCFQTIAEKNKIKMKKWYCVKIHKPQQIKQLLLFTLPDEASGTQFYTGNSGTARICSFCLFSQLFPLFFCFYFWLLGLFPTLHYMCWSWINQTNISWHKVL